MVTDKDEKQLGISIKRYPSFILGKCRCGCGTDIPIRGYGYLRLYVSGHQRKGKKSYNWKGGRSKDNTHGYIWIYKPDHPTSNKNGYILEHRYLMEIELKRSLKGYEDIHHIDGNKENNRIENLQLLSHSEHLSIHKKGNKYSKKDMSGRKCSNCGSNKTYTNKKGSLSWHKYNEDQFICNKCKMKLYHKQLSETEVM